MSNGWKEFLLAQGATYVDGSVRDFGDPLSERRAAREDNVVMDLSSLTWIAASGTDAKTFLNGQLTCDVDKVDTTHSQIGAWCSPKGRMLVVFRLIRRGDTYLLQLPISLRDDIVKRLRMYVLRSKVVLEECVGDLISIGLTGPDAPALVRSATGVAPDTSGQMSTTADGTMVLRLPGAVHRFEILSPPETAPRLWETLQSAATPVGYDAWIWHDIAAGIPVVLPETSDLFIPQMANLELIGGVSFDKGCYTGQEIVARVHYRGRLKQRMYRANTAVETTPHPGAPIYAPNKGEQLAGTVVIATPHPDGGQDLLAVMYCDSAEHGDLRLGHPDGAPLRVETLPYPLTLPV